MRATTATRRAFAIAVLAVLLVVGPVAVALQSTSGTAQACSIGVTDYPRGALREVANTRVLLIGTVISERSIPQPPDTEPAWESEVIADVVIKGEVPDEPLLIPYIGFLGGDCSGGPRLREGERVLIPMYWGRPSYGNGEEAWQLHGIFSKVLIEGDEATLEWAYGSEPLGEAEAVIRAYGLAVGADADRIEAAVAAARGPGQDSGWQLPWPYVAGAVMAMVVVVGLLLRHRLSGA